MDDIIKMLGQEIGNRGGIIETEIVREGAAMGGRAGKERKGF